MEGFYISLTIPYDNGERQIWNYDGSQYGSLPILKRDMTRDFKDPRFDRKAVVVYASGYSNIRSPFEIKLSDEKGSDFTKLVFSEIEKRQNGN